MNISEDASSTAQRESTTVRYRPFYRPFELALPNFVLIVGTCNLDERIRWRAMPWEDEERERREAKRTSLMRPKVEQSAARTRYFKASFTSEIDLIEGTARNENRMRSTRSGPASRFYACLRALAFRVVEERRSHWLVPDRNTAASETDPFHGSSFANESTIVLICVNVPGPVLFWARLNETQGRGIRGGEHKRALTDSSIKVGRPLSNPSVILMSSV